MTFEEFIEGKEGITYGELYKIWIQEYGEDLNPYSMVFDIHPYQFFYGFKKTLKAQWHEKLDGVLISDWLKDKSIEEGRKKVLMNWFRDYTEYKNLESLRGSNPQYYFTLTQQLMLLHFLEKAKVFNLSGMAESRPKQANVLQVLFNRSYSSLETELRRYENTSRQEFYFTIENLSFVKDVFESIGFTKGIDEVDKELNRLN